MSFLDQSLTLNYKFKVIDFYFNAFSVPRRICPPNLVEIGWIFRNWPILWRHRDVISGRLTISRCASFSAIDQRWFHNFSMNGWILANFQSFAINWPCDLDLGSQGHRFFLNSIQCPTGHLSNEFGGNRTKCDDFENSGILMTSLWRHFRRYRLFPPFPRGRSQRTSDSIRSIWFHPAVFPEV